MPGNIREGLFGLVIFRKPLLPSASTPVLSGAATISHGKSIALSDTWKDELRTRWTQNEIKYLREQRRKVDVRAFVKLKTIDHGGFAAFTGVQTPSCYVTDAFGVVSLVRERTMGKLFAMKQVRVTLLD